MTNKNILKPLIKVYYVFYIQKSYHKKVAQWTNMILEAQQHTKNTYYHKLSGTYMPLKVAR